MRRKNDVYLDDAELQQIQQVAEKKGLSVSAYIRRVSVRDARDELLEQAANRRLAADRRQRYEETFKEAYPEPEPLPELTPSPEPTETPKPLTDEPMTMEQFEVQRAAALHAHRTRLERLSHCVHRGVTPGSVCPKCNQLVRPRGSQGRVLTKPRFSFSTPHGKGGL
jgi:hypothetical protein